MCACYLNVLGPDQWFKFSRLISYCWFWTGGIKTFIISIGPVHPPPPPNQNAQRDGTYIRYSRGSKLDVVVSIKGLPKCINVSPICLRKPWIQHLALFLHFKPCHACVASCNRYLCFGKFYLSFFWIEITGLLFKLYSFMWFFFLDIV